MHLPLTLLDTMGGLPGLELQSVMSVLAQFFLATLRVIGNFLACSAIVLTFLFQFSVAEYFGFVILYHHHKGVF